MGRVIARLVEGAAVLGLGLVPGGSIVAPFVPGAVTVVESEARRRRSRVISAAERRSGMSREEIEDAIRSDPRLVPLVTRVLFTAGMAGYDETLDLLGAALGDVIRVPTTLEETELVVDALLALKPTHIRILKLLGSGGSSGMSPDLRLKVGTWWAAQLAEELGVGPRTATLCLAGLASHGMVQSAATFGGPAFSISDLGRTVLEVLQDLES